MKTMVYFYTENKEVKKYVYCTLCQAGPFKQDEEAISFIRKGAVNTPVNYCRKCGMVHGRIGEFRSLKEVPNVVIGIKDKIATNFTTKISISEIFPNSVKVNSDNPVDYSGVNESVDNEVEEPMEVVVEKKMNTVVKEKVEAKKEKKEIRRIESVDGVYSFIVVRCLDGTLYSSVAADVEHSIKNMNRGKGSDYTKPKTRRPVQLLYTERRGDKRESTVYRSRWDKMPIKDKEEFLKKC